MRLRLLTALIACAAWFAAAPPLGAVQLPADFVNEVLVTGLDQPTSMAFLPDGRVLITEQRTGKVRMVVNGQIAATDPVFVVPSLNSGGYERGFEGIAVDPRWPARPYVYLYYTRIGNFCRLVRYRASGKVSNPLGDSLALGSPLILIDDILDNDPNHQSGCLRFAPDRSLFLSVGDDETWCDGADSTKLRGALLRLDVMRLGDAAGGPVPRDSITPVDLALDTQDPNARLEYAYGMRNPWRFQVDPVTNLIYGADVGEDLREELNEIRPGDYLGWPWREGNVTVVRSNCPEPGGPGAHPYVHPIVAMPRGVGLTAIISAGAYRPVLNAPSNWPSVYGGDVFYGEYYAGVLRRLRKTGTTWGFAPPDPGQPNDSTWASGLFSSVDYLVGPDGSLWWLRQFSNEDMESVSGSLQRIRFTGQAVHVGAGPDREVALSSRPNPFRGDVELSFRMGGSGYVRLELFDLSGRLVRRLLDGSVPSGTHRERWDGRDASGRAIAPGVYLARLETPLGVRALRVLRIQ